MAIRTPILSIGLMAAGLFTLTGCGQFVQTKNQPRAIRGVLELSAWDFAKDGTVNLSGEYEFYWQQHLAPKDFSQATPPVRSGFIRVPSYWKGHVLNGIKLPGTGYATYRLRIFLNDSSFRKLGLKFLDMGTAYTVFVNGKEILSVGIAGQTPETTVPKYFPQVVDLASNSNQIELIYQVSNFHHHRGGAWESIHLGTIEKITAMRERRLALDLILFGSLVVIGLYHLALFSLRKSDPSSYLFGSFCLLIAVRLLTTVERYLLHIYPSMSWEVFVKIEYLSIYLAVPVFAIFLYRLFSQDFHKSVMTIMSAIGLIFSGLVALTPAKIFTQTLHAFEFFIVMSVVYVCSILILCAVRKREGAMIILFGFLFLSATIVNDILDADIIIQTGHLLHWGLFIFIFSHAFMLSSRYARAFTTIERQRLRLTKVNASLEAEIAEHKHTKEELHRQERELTDFIENASVGIHWVGPDGKILWANQSELNLLGFTRSEYVGHHIAEFHVDKKVIADILYRLAQHEILHDHEAQLRCKDSSIKHVLINSSVLWRNGQFIHTQCFTRDITVRKQAEEALRDSEERFRQLAENIEEVFWLGNPEKDQIIYISAGYEKIWGRTCESLHASPKNWLEAIHPEDRNRVVEAAHTKQVSGQYDEIYRIQRPDGSIRWIRDRAFPIPDQTGAIYRIAGIAEDITEFKRVEEALRQSEEGYRGLIESSPEAIFVEQAGKLVYINPAGLRLMGYSALAEHNGHGLKNLFNKNAECPLEKFSSMKTDSVPAPVIEVQFIRKNGKLLDGEVTFINTMYQGKPAIQALARDITETKYLRQKAERMERLAALGQLSTTIAHEIRNPLGSISLNFQYLVRRMEIPPLLHKTLRDIEDGMARIQNIINDILGFARTTLPALQKNDLHKVLDSAVNSVIGELEQTGIIIKMNYTARQPEDMIDANQIVQVCVNLFLNAKEAMGNGGQLTISTISRENSLEIQIEDTGEGIAPENLKKIYDPFFTTRPHGSGLGLAVVLRILEQHHAPIFVESKTGAGTKFIITFPLA